MKGAYVLLIRLDEDRDLKIGALGMVSFPAGFYAYTGSSMVNLERRVGRHFREEKKMKWHIDHFLREAEVVRAVLFPSDEREECEINRMVFDMDDGTVVIKGFGSTARARRTWHTSGGISRTLSTRRSGRPCIRPRERVPLRSRGKHPRRSR